MKTFTHIVFFAGLLFLNTTIQAQQIVHIPDPAFKQALLDHLPIIDTNGDGEIQVSEAEAVTELIVGDPWGSYNIQDLTGIEAFVNITFLDCQNNQLSSLNLNHNLLLEDLIFDDNNLTIIDISENIKLKGISCHNNNLTAIDLSQNPQLEGVYINNNYLTTIDLIQNSQLIGLDIGNNQFDFLDVSQNLFLRYLVCQNNNLTFLDVRNGNNENFTVFNAKDNPDLTCIFVDNAEYSETNWTDVDPASTFVETQAQCDALGFNEMFLKEINILPNPVENILNIELSGQYSQELSGEIVDITGKIIATHLLKTDTSLDLSYLPSGIYFLNIYTNQNKRLTKKLVKL